MHLEWLRLTIVHPRALLRTLLVNMCYTSYIGCISRQLCEMALLTSLSNRCTGQALSCWRTLRALHASQSHSHTSREIRLDRKPIFCTTDKRYSSGSSRCSRKCEWRGHRAKKSSMIVSCADSQGIPSIPAASVREHRYDCRAILYSSSNHKYRNESLSSCRPDRACTTRNDTHRTSPHRHRRDSRLSRSRMRSPHCTRCTS